jgi:hypothetical protein
MSRLMKVRIGILIGLLLFATLGYVLAIARLWE